MSDETPVRRLRERLVYQNRWLRVHVDDVITADGPTQWNRILEGAEDDGPAVVVIPTDDAMGVLFVEIYRYALASWSWELPRGYGEPGATAEESARRELREETGCEASEVSLIGWLAPNSGLVATRVAVVLATGISGTEVPQRAEAIRSLRWIPREGLRGFLREQPTLDGITAAALALLP